MGSLDNSFDFDWGMDVKNGSEGGGKLICKVGCIGSWFCLERGSENVTFEVVDINCIVRVEHLICRTSFRRFNSLILFSDDK